MGYNNITYITKSYDSPLNKYMRSYVAPFLVYQPENERDFVVYIHKLVSTLNNEMMLTK